MVLGPGSLGFGEDGLGVCALHSQIHRSGACGAGTMNRVGGYRGHLASF